MKREIARKDGDNDRLWLLAIFELIFPVFSNLLINQLNYNLILPDSYLAFWLKLDRRESQL